MDGDKIYVKSHQHNPYTNGETLLSVRTALDGVDDKSRPITVVIHNHYILKGISEWIESWESRNWCNSHNEPIANVDLWIDILILKNQFADIKFVQH